MTVLSFTGVTRTYAGESPVHALKNATTVISQGDYVAIEGPSGAGKSTFLNILALLDSPTNGTYKIDDLDVSTLKDKNLAWLRSETFSFIFQSFHLIPSRSVLDNAALGLEYRKIPSQQAKNLALVALEFVGLGHKAAFRASQLSGGECQRVAIARAIATGAPILVADEPTGNLDSKNSETVLDLLGQLNDQGKTIVVVTHDPQVAKRSSRRLLVKDGVMYEKPETTSTTTITNTAATPPPGKPSKVKSSALIHDAWASVTSALSRSIGLAMMVVLGVAVTLTTLGLAQTARYQVTDAFDANLNRRVGVSTSGEGEEGEAQARAVIEASDPEVIKRILEIPGVEAASIIAEYADVDVTVRVNSEPEPVRLYGILPNSPDAKLFQIDRGGNPDQPLTDDEVLIGKNLARALDLGPLISSPTIWIKGKPFRVVGAIADAGMRAELPNALVTTEASASGLSRLMSAGLELRTTPGAAQQVAEYAPLAWNPVLADSFAVMAPADPTAMRDTIDESVQTILLTLTVVAALAALLTLTNSMATSVQRRIGEFGMRRAIGCRRSHLASLVITESTIIGLIGGIGGTILALLAILGVTIFQRWQPVMDFALVPLGIIGGIVVGIMGSLLAIRRAIKIAPAEALRSQ